MEIWRTHGVFIMVFLLFTAFVVGLSGAMMPGSLLTYTIRQSLSAGPKAGFIIVAGHAALELGLVILIFMGFDMVLQSNAAQICIGFVGGILLCYMGYGMIRDSLKNRVSLQTEGGGASSRNMFLSGIVISAANPYFLLWWAVIGLGFIMQAYNSFAYLGVIIFYIGHICADIFWYGFISIVVGKTKKFIKEKPYRIIIIILGCLLVFFGIKFVYGAVAGLMRIL